MLKQRVVDWWRGYSEGDVMALLAKWQRGLEAPHGHIIPVTQREYRALCDGALAVYERKINMDNQHQKIKGYRDLSEEEIALMNEIKTKGTELGELVFRLRTYTAKPMSDGSQPGPAFDQRWVSIGATHLQEGLMALTRSVAQPTTF